MIEGVGADLRTGHRRLFSVLESLVDVRSSLSLTVVTGWLLHFSSFPISEVASSPMIRRACNRG